MKLFDRITKVIDNEYASVASDGLDADINYYIDTGSYTLNALLSGSIHGGIPNNKIVAFAGEQATGKTFYVLSIIKNFLDSNPEASVVFFESEQAVSSEMLSSRGIDLNRIFVVPVSTVQEFKTNSLKIVDEYLSIPEKERTPMLFALDSLGMLSTTKEMEDSAAGKETKDMTRTQVIKAAFRVLTLKLGKAGIPMLVTNHTYDVIGSMFPSKEMGGGGGLKYAASIIVFLGKSKVKDGKERIGNIVKCKLNKARLTREEKIVETMLSFDTGLDRYYGLVDLALKYDIFKKETTRIVLPDGTKTFEKTIYREPEKYFTEDILKQLDEVAGREFLYGSSNEIAEDGEE